jgi:hypothetical protein
MAVVQDTGYSSYSLSRDFCYTPSETLSFTMQAIANTRTLSGGGVFRNSQRHYNSVPQRAQ